MGNMNIKELLKEYLTVLKKEEIETLASILDKNCTIYTPLDGLISGRDKIKSYIIKQKDWLNNKNARVEIFNIIDVKNRIVIELNIFYEKGEKTIELPFVVVLDIENNSFHPDKKVSHSHEGSVGNLCLENISENKNEILQEFNFDKIEEAVNQLLV